MKYIRKQPEPVEFVQWKSEFPGWNEGRVAKYDDLLNPLKNQVKDSLIAEQGKICSYCGGRIHRRNTHIEHLKPQHSCTPEETVDYQNIVASCEGENRLLHCGHNKHEWYDANLFVSPLREDCEQFFTYTLNGEMEPCDDSVKGPMAAETIRQLGLDTAKLNALRKAALDGILMMDDFSVELIDFFLQECQVPNEEGDLLEFAAYLQGVLGVLRSKMV